MKTLKFALLALTIITLSSFKNHNKSESKPNIIYILADDLGYGDVSFNGQNKFKTPNIDELATKGMVFTQHYSGSTVCAPSRSTLLTGQHTGHTAIRGNKAWQPEGQYPMPKATYTLAEMLKEAGYTNGVFGKWGLGYPGSEGDPNRQGFDEFYGYNCQRLAHNYYPYHLWHNQEKVTLEGNVGKQQNDYAADLIHDQALQFISDNKEHPFFMYYASPLPHAELLLPQSYIDAYKGQFLPEKNYKGYDDGEKYRQGPYGSQPDSHAAFAAMVTLLDKQVGEVITKLEDEGIMENTIVIFTSDNGPHQEGGADPKYFDSNAMYRGFKRDLYEGGIHIPMIARWDNVITPNTTTDHISAFWDVLPTLAEVVGKDVPENIDGLSFLPTLIGKGKQAKHDYLYWEFHEKGGRQAVRQGKWKAVKYHVSVGDRAVELYNLEEDPSEENDLADLHPEIVEDLVTIMKEARTDSPVFLFKSETFLQEKKTK